MAEKLSLRTNANGDIYVYVEDTVGNSLAFGADNPNGVIALNTLATPNVVPSSPSANITIDPSTNGNILFRPHGSGKSEFNTGNVQITEKSLYLPHTDNSGVNGIIFTNDPNLGYQRTIAFPDDWNVYIGKGVGGVGPWPNPVGVSYNVIIGAEGSFNAVVNPSLHNVGIGQGTFQDFTGGSSNIAIGRFTLSSITTGSGNIGLGHSSGSALTTNDSDNVCISSVGVSGDNGVIRIGTNGTQVSTFITGIYGVTPVDTPQMVVIDDLDNLGTQPIPFGVYWVEITGPSATMSPNMGYIANNGGGVTLTLPSSASQGSIIEVVGKGSGGWTIAQNVGQTIVWDTAISTTTGAGGSMNSTDGNDYVQLLCITTDTDFMVLASKGNLNLV